MISHEELKSFLTPPFVFIVAAAELPSDLLSIAGKSGVLRAGRRDAGFRGKPAVRRDNHLPEEHLRPPVQPQRFVFFFATGLCIGEETVRQRPHEDRRRSLLSAERSCLPPAG